MNKIILIFVLMSIISIFFISYSLYESPISKHFCELYHNKSKNPYADLIRKLNRYDLCGKMEDNIFDQYIHWNGEIIAGVKNNILVFKGTDSLNDIEMDLSPTISQDKRGMVYTSMYNIYKAIKPQLDQLYCDKVTGWSLGAVLSILYSYDHSQNINEVIVFGQPPVFSKTFVDDYNTVLGDKTISYIHRFDLIAQPLDVFQPFIKPEYLNAYRAGKMHYIKTGDLFNVFKHGLGYYHMSYLE
jgi:hypothetical protein